MARSSPPAGGILIAAGSIVGAGVGLSRDQPTIGLLIGLGLGTVAALLIWWRSR